MLKLISALTLASAMFVAPAFAQETTNGNNGQAVDGHGNGGSVQNRLIPDGPGDTGFVIHSHGLCYLQTRSGSLLQTKCPANN